MDTETVVRDSQRRFESASASLEPELEHLDQRGEFSSGSPSRSHGLGVTRTWGQTVFFVSGRLALSITGTGPEKETKNKI